MSSIKISPNASGTGEFVIAAPNSNTNRTLTLPDATGTIITTAGGAAISGTTGAFTTTVGVGGATPAASGAGITFPATASASSDANTLDDYEEGTFTASIGTSGGSITLNSSFNTLAYTKIGRVVVVTGRLKVSSVSSPTGNSTIQGFPFEFVAGTEDSLLTGSVTFIENATGDQNSFYLETLNANTSAYLWKGNRVSTATSFSDDEIITINLTYMI